MHSTKTLIISVLVVGILMFVVGRVLWDEGDVDNSEETPTPTTGYSPTPSMLLLVTPQSYSVRLSSGGPLPATLNIRAGDTVSFLGEDTRGFSVRSNTCAGFDAMRALFPGERYSLTFREPRTCIYFDSLQAAANSRQGTIIVQ